MSLCLRHETKVSPLLVVGRLVLWLWVATCSIQAADTSRLITSIREFRAATLKPGESERTVQIYGTVTYADPTWKSLFVQDDTGAVSLDFPRHRLAIVPGDRLLIEGAATPRSATNLTLELREVVLRVLGRGKWPKPMPTDAVGLFLPQNNCRLVEVSGVVRSALELGRLQLQLETGGKQFPVWVRHYQTSDLDRLLDAKVTLQGVCNHERDAAGRVAGVSLFVVDFKSIKVDRLGPEDPYQEACTPIASLRARSQVGSGQKRVRVQGAVVDQSLGESLRIRDDTGEMLLITPQHTPLIRGDRVDVVGFPDGKGESMTLEDCQYRVVQRSSSGAVTAAQADLSLPTLHSLREVLALSRDEARKRYPVRAEGVVTHFDPRWKQLFIQDGDQAICVEVGDLPLQLESGQRVEISGATKPGGVLSMLTPALVQVLGTDKLPEPIRMTYQQGINGDYDCRRVKVKATVQSVDVGEDHINLELSAWDGRYFCSILQTPGSLFYQSLANAVVEVEGICVLNVNESGNPAGITIAVDRERDVTVVERAPADPFALVTQEIEDIVRFLPGDVASRRLKVKGIVTLWRPGGELYLQGPRAAIFARTQQAGPLEPGDEIELVGYRVQGGCVPHLENAEFRILNRGERPEPKQLRPMEALAATNHGLLVRMEAYLVEDVPFSASPQFTLESGQSLFKAAIEHSESSQRPPSWRAGSLLSLTGVLYLQADESRNPKTIRLLVPSLADVEVLSTPSWFTRQRVTGLLVLLFLGVMLSLAWIAALRRRVSHQTELIRQRLESEAAMEKRLALVWETSADGMRLTDEAGTTVQVNGAYCRMVGKTRQELEGHPFSVIFREEDAGPALTDYRESFARRTLPFRQESAALLWDGRKVWFDSSSALLEHADSPPLLLSQFRDVSERKLAEDEKEKLQDQLLQARKTESIGRLAGGVAHDFNNMLQVILGNTSLALQETPPESRVHEELCEIQRSAERSAELTRQLLAFARKQAVSPKVLNLNNTVSGLIKMLQRLIGENLQLAWSPGGNVWPVKIDPAQIDQVLVNLCVNARDAMPGVGRISIETANVHLDETYVRTHPECVPGDYVMLVVSDTGPGLDPQAREHLFEPFFTTKELGKGTGLGLATVFGIVKQNLGLINVYSESGKGTTFKIYLPRTEGTAVSAHEASVTPSLPNGSETVLLVEDEEQILNLGKRILQQRGYQVLAAQSPKEALELARKYAGRIDLLITDVVMPGMNGKELRRQIDVIQPGIRCIYVSGYTAEVIAHDGLLEGDVHFLQKPFTLRTLTEKIRETLG